MQPRDFVHTFVAAETKRFNVAGRYLHIMRAPTAGVFVSLDEGSELERVAGEGLYIGEGFKLVTVRSAVAQTVRLMVADEPQVSGGGAGTTAAAPSAVSITPSSTVTATADNALAASATETIAANATRRRITIGVLSTALAPIRVKHSGGPALSGIEIGPGQYQEFQTTAALDVTNDDAVNATSYYTFEESGP